ncbi:hypothetical protein MKW94_020033 [Papaver nudicaule]|uniref:Uncharacterized protein n=1 Tax=Papaver nudicaule TaxID=74823 RepID=A0AA41SBR5_PAPNU|nr:hypothetical protein [Papaver nudicaule]
MWVRQRENIPLTVELFKDVDSEYVDRVVQLARDRYTFKPDNEFTTDVIKERIRDRYKGFRTELSNHYQKTCNSDYDRALATPHKKITNREDWKFLCDHFRSDEFQKRSAQGRKARSQQVLPHSNGPISFSQTLHERVLNGEPTDPVTMFEVTHNFKKCRDTTKCDDIKVYIYVFFS